HPGRRWSRGRRPGARRASRRERRGALLLRQANLPLLLRAGRRSGRRLLHRRARAGLRGEAEPLRAARRADTHRRILVSASTGGTTVKRLSRRTLLRGAGGIALGLPFLEAMAPASVNAPATT